MPLKLTLKPHEKVLIGTAVVAAGDEKTELVVLNQVPVLRQKDIITLEDADTAAKMLYFTILNMYAEPHRQQQFHKAYFDLLRTLMTMPLGAEGMNLVMDISQRILEGDVYKALKLGQRLIARESEVLRHVDEQATGLSADAAGESREPGPA